MQAPPPIRRVPPSLGKWLNQLRAFVLATRPIRSATCEVHETDSGTQILPDAAAAAGAAGSASSTTRGLEFFASGLDLGVHIGTINGLICLEMYAGDSPVKVKELTTAEGFIFAKATFDAPTWQWTEADIHVQALETIDNTATVAYLLMGSWSITDDVLTITQEVFGPVEIPVCDLLFA